MQFDYIDRKTKEAANHHHPVYDEMAWAAMEVLLNKHLPQKEDNRKRFIFFLLLLIGIGGTGLFIARPWKSEKIIAATEQTIQQKQSVMYSPLTEQHKEMTKTAITAEEEKNKVNSDATTENNNKVTPVLSVPRPPDDLSKKRNFQEKRNKNSNELTPASRTAKTEKIQPGNNAEKNNRGKENDTKDKLADAKTTGTVATATPVNDLVSMEKKQNESVVDENPIANTAKPPTIEQSKAGEVEKESLLITQNKAAKDKKKTKKSNSFFVTLSTGPDVSYANKGKLGTMKLLAGGGLGYTFKDRLTIRTGFYSGRKIYTALPGAYHPPAIFYTYYPNLEKVDANCKVYEIPFFISYNFGRTSKQNWFAAAGVSSYLMKSETYNYFYKYSPSSPIVNRKRTINNENKHYFSALTFSAGYFYNINRYISFMVEPYIKVPISGVGYGKVKLNSAGLLFSIGIKPFGSKKSSIHR